MSNTTTPKEKHPAWERPNPFVLPVTVTPELIDELGHTNNVHYLHWLHQCTWAHSSAVGYPPSQMLATGCAMAVRDVRMSYLRATFEGDQLWVADWLTHNDGRLRATRSFQILRPADEACVMRAEIDYICINVSSGRPQRMPEGFLRAYAVQTTS
ncbi:MAG: acyl-CoA thioesterase [Gammaproteobacteria bacterium]|jgi:acyl-CoA thioester hydrolase|nr:acyl-CoA thioesterase [Gammaproteobacteria bacterium]MCH1549620.1 acyl-CoA thioesterase [Pseudomonadales bacterium]